VGAGGEEVLEPRPMLAHAVEDGFGMRRASDRHQKTAISTAMCRLRLTIFLPASSPPAFSSGFLTD